MPFIDSLPSWLIAAFTLFLVLTAILWAFLPFAVFGIKERLDRQLNNLRSIDEHLQAQSILLAKIEETLRSERRPE